MAEEKRHPVARETEKDLKPSKRKLEEFVDELIACTDSDDRNRIAHMNKLTNWEGRRYQQFGKNPEQPWVGSSNWRSPVMDAEIRKSKAPLMGVFSADPIVSFIPMSTIAVEKADGAEQTMQWLIKSRMRDVEDTFEILADKVLQNGYAIAKITYEYETQIISETIRLAEIDPDIIIQVGEAQAALLNGLVAREAFEEELTQFIADKFGLNPMDEIDLKAIEEVMNFIIKGDDEIQIKRREVIHDAPRVSHIDPSLLIPETGVHDLQDAERITEICFQSSNELLALARDGYYNKEAVKRVIKNANSPDEDEIRGDGSGQFNEVLNSRYEQMRADREGLVFTDKKDLFRVHNTYTLYDIDGDGVKEKVLIIYHHGTGEVLRFMEYPYEHGMWPFVQIRNEYTDDRYYSSRGIPEIIDQIDEMITKNRRQKENSMSIANVPSFKYRLGSNINPNNFKWAPGKFYPVIQMNDFEQVQVTAKDFVFDNEEQILQFWTERVLGSTDLALQSKGGSEARTRAEINVVAGIGQQATQMSVKRWQRALKKIWEQVWALWLQYGPEEFVVSQSLGTVRPMSRHEIQGKFDLQPVGTAGEINPDLKFVRSQERFNQLLQLVQLGALGILGDEVEIDFTAAFLDMLNKDDFVTASRIVRRRSPEEIQQIQQQRAEAEAQAAQQQAIMDNQPTSIQDLQAQVKQLKKEAPNGGAQQVRL